MSDPHHLAPEHWTFVVEDPGGHWRLDVYRAIWALEVHFQSAQSRWHCIARAEGYADGYREDFVGGTSDEPQPAMRRCYEMADSWVQHA